MEETARGGFRLRHPERIKSLTLDAVGCILKGFDNM